MKYLIFRSLIPLIIMVECVLTDNEVKESICSWIQTQLECTRTQFKCFNSKACLRREQYCNGVDDCGDNSDELYCSGTCPTNFYKCQYYKRCIPSEWRCNGHSDCSNGDDEHNCRNYSPPKIESTEQQIRTDIKLNSVLSWLRSQKLESSAEKWGPNVDTLALAFHFADQSSTGSSQTETEKEIAYELNIQLLSRIARKKLKDIPSTELASFVNAFLVTCIDPRNFHGYDVIQELRKRVDQENYTNPYVLLALCNAGETITESDKSKLIDTFENKHRTFWTDMQAIVVMALACANKQPGNEIDSDSLREMTLELKQQQYRNGSIINLPTTALVLQALISVDSEIDPDNFDEMKALQELLRNQKLDGSFGDLMSTFLVAPVLSCQSLANITSNHCQSEKRNEISALENLSRKSGPKMEVQYSLWIGKDKDLGRNLILRVPQNMSLYTIMETAAELDSRFKFEYSIKDRKPFINAISEMRDNPLMGEFWFLYHIKDGKPALTNKSPADIIPKDNDHYVMWYRQGTWVD